MNNHPNKEIREAVDYALERRWRLRKGRGHSHPWGVLLCPSCERGGCKISVNSTPKNPYYEAHRIKRKVELCTHTSKR
ncbi:MAG: hypothetical protein LBT46_12615 [Planctomycetaceae bacterium]|nr:hypothetical protein [Planctomycetaceae bacterium]